LATLLAIPATNAQNFGSSGTTAGAFSHVQPLNTTILGQYGHGPAVYPSRKLLLKLYAPLLAWIHGCLILTIANATGTGVWADAAVKAKAFVAQLTLAEKSDMVTGQPGPCVGNIVAIPRLNFTGLCLQDGPLAIRVADYASTFEAGVTAASSWDREIMYERGYAMGQEFKAKGAHIALS
jgi:beta-glucosidase